MSRLLSNFARRSDSREPRSAPRKRSSSSTPAIDYERLRLVDSKRECRAGILAEGVAPRTGPPSTRSLRSSGSSVTLASVEHMPRSSSPLSKPAPQVAPRRRHEPSRLQHKKAASEGCIKRSHSHSDVRLSTASSRQVVAQVIAAVPSVEVTPEDLDDFEDIDALAKQFGLYKELRREDEEQQRSINKLQKMLGVPPNTVRRMVERLSNPEQGHGQHRHLEPIEDSKLTPDLLDASRLTRPLSDHAEPESPVEEPNVLTQLKQEVDQLRASVGAQDRTIEILSQRDVPQPKQTRRATWDVGGPSTVTRRPKLERVQEGSKDSIDIMLDRVLLETPPADSPATSTISIQSQEDHFCPSLTLSEGSSDGLPPLDCSAAPAAPEVPGESEESEEPEVADELASPDEPLEPIENPDVEWAHKELENWWSSNSSSHHLPGFLNKFQGEPPHHPDDLLLLNTAQSPLRDSLISPRTTPEQTLAFRQRSSADLARKPPGMLQVVEINDQWADLQITLEAMNEDEEAEYAQSQLDAAEEGDEPRDEDHEGDEDASCASSLIVAYATEVPIATAKLLPMSKYNRAKPDAASADTHAPALPPLKSARRVPRESFRTLPRTEKKLYARRASMASLWSAASRTTVGSRCSRLFKDENKPLPPVPSLNMDLVSSRAVTAS